MSMARCPKGSRSPHLARRRAYHHHKREPLPTVLPTANEQAAAAPARGTSPKRDELCRDCTDPFWRQRLPKGHPQHRGKNQPIVPEVTPRQPVILKEPGDIWNMTID